MNYVDSLNLFGIEAKEIPCIKGSGAPTDSTVGVVGLFYMNTDNGDVYKCTAVNGSSYTWLPMGNSSQGSGDVVDLSGVVKSVNGQTPDENGNVEIDVSGSEDSVDYVAQDTAPEDTSVLWIDTSDTSDTSDSSGGISVTGATVGQTVKIAEVDENGVPTAWEPVDFPNGNSENWVQLGPSKEGSYTPRMAVYPGPSTTVGLKKLLLLINVRVVNSDGTDITDDSMEHKIDICVNNSSLFNSLTIGAVGSTFTKSIVEIECVGPAAFVSGTYRMLGGVTPSTTYYQFSQAEIYAPDGITDIEIYSDGGYAFDAGSSATLWGVSI